MLFGKPRFRELTPEFISFKRLYSEDRRTTASNVRILERWLGDDRIDEIGARQIERFISDRLERGIGRSTLNRQRATLSRFFSWAIERGYHPGPNPVRQVKKFRESTGRTRYLSEDEYSKLFLAAAAHLKPILLAAVHTGGRMGELLALRWQDVDLEGGFVTFRKETTKNGRERFVPLSQDLAAHFRSRRRPPEGPVFAFRGEGLKSVRTAFERARRKAGLTGLRFHDLRHTFASWYVQNGGDIKRLKDYLGHSSLSLTERYTHLSTKFLADGVQYIGPPRARSPMRGDEKPGV